MLRTIGGVIGGYVAIRVFFFVTFAVTYLVVGSGRVFAPSSYEVTFLWLIVSTGISFLAAVVGGKVCALIARSAAAVMGLATLVLLLGVVSAIPVLSASNTADSLARTDDVSVISAMTNARQPAWIALILPWVGLAGATIGGKLGSGPGES